MQIQIAVGIIIHEVELSGRSNEAHPSLNSHIDKSLLTGLRVITDLILHKYVRVHAIGVGYVKIDIAITIIVTPGYCACIAWVSNQIHIRPNIDKTFSAAIFIQSYWFIQKNHH